MKRWQENLISFFVGLIVLAAILLVATPPRGSAVELLPAPTQPPVIIYVTGAVLHPGIYELPQGSRVEGAIQAAGGFRDDANLQVLNQAARIKDGEKIYVPAAGEAALPSPEDTSHSGSSSDGLVLTTTPLNLNTATLEDLQTLPGIGETRAKDIIAYREGHAGFKSVEEIQDVPGIGPVMFERLKDLLCVE